MKYHVQKYKGSRMVAGTKRTYMDSVQLHTHLYHQAFGYVITKSPFTYKEASSSAAITANETKSYGSLTCEDVINLVEVEEPMLPMPTMQPHDVPATQTSDNTLHSSEVDSLSTQQNSFQIQEEVCSYRTDVTVTGESYNSDADTYDLPEKKTRKRKSKFVRCCRIFGCRKSDEDSAASGTSHNDGCFGVRDKGYRARRRARRRLARTIEEKRMRRRAKANAKAGFFRRCFNSLLCLNKQALPADKDDEFDPGFSGVRGKGYNARRKERQLRHPKFQQLDTVIRTPLSIETDEEEPMMQRVTEKASTKSIATSISIVPVTKKVKIQRETKGNKRVDVATMTYDELLDNFITNNMENVDTNNFVCSVCKNKEKREVESSRPDPVTTNIPIMPNKRKRKSGSPFFPSKTVHSKPVSRPASIISESDMTDVRFDSITIPNSSETTARSSSDDGARDSGDNVRSGSHPVGFTSGFEAVVEDLSDGDSSGSKPLLANKERVADGDKLSGTGEGEKSNVKEGFCESLKKWLCCC